MSVRGIGGIFFKSENPEATAAWYEEHLGIWRDDKGYTTMGWRELDGDFAVGQTVWSAFDAETDYFDPSDAEFMVNYRVYDLDSLLDTLEAAGVTIAGEPQEFEYGKFAWVVDCDGRKVELWEPPSGETGFSVTVPPGIDPDLPGEWLTEPGSGVATSAAESTGEAIIKECSVRLPQVEVWRLWTSSEGLAKWLVENSEVELRLGGSYEWYFDADAVPGARGGEGCKILSYLPPRMLSFTWNAPPHLPYTRKRFTHVILELEAIDDSNTNVRLTHLGWPSQETDDHTEWSETLAYYDSAWERVLDSLLVYASGTNR